MDGGEGGWAALICLLFIEFVDGAWLASSLDLTVIRTSGMLLYLQLFLSETFVFTNLPEPLKFAIAICSAWWVTYPAIKPNSLLFSF